MPQWTQLTGQNHPLSTAAVSNSAQISKPNNKEREQEPIRAVQQRHRSEKLRLYAPTWRNSSFSRSKTEAQQPTDSSAESYKGQSTSVMLYESASIELWRSIDLAGLDSRQPCCRAARGRWWLDATGSETPSWNLPVQPTEPAVYFHANLHFSAAGLNLQSWRG